MTYKARFVHGNRYFNLDAGEFSLFQDFIFPAADEALNVSTPNVGSMSGGRVVSKTAQDRWWAWSVMVTGTTNAQTHLAARRLSAWLSQSIEDKTDKVYFEYTPNYVIPAPIWGQHGAPYRFEVKAAIVDLDGSYYVAEIPNKVLILPISLFVAPYALGARQKLAQAMGAVFEDAYGTADGMPRGTIINGGLTNRVPNSSFETNTTGWAATNGAIERTSEQAWVGSYGLRLTVATTNTTAVAAYGNVYTGTPLGQLNYVLSARVYIPSDMVGKTVSISIGESGGTSAAEETVAKSLTPTVSDWHYMFATGTLKKADRTAISVYLGINAAATTYAGHWVIWDAIQLVGPDVYNIYPYIDGDQIGCAWTGTAHGTTSTSTAGYLRIPVTSGDAINMANGSMIAILKMPFASTDIPADSDNRVMYTNTGLRVFFHKADSKFYIHDNTTSVGVDASWAAGDIITVHAAWGPAGMWVAYNGTASATQRYVNPGAAAYVYIGSNVSSPPTERILGTFLDFSLFGQPFTATQMTADYANSHAHADGGDGMGQRLSSTPYLWTKDGDSQVDNCTQGTTYNHWAVAAGIQGGVDAETEIVGTLGTAYATVNLSNFASRNYVNPAAADTMFFADNSGTPLAGACGGEVDVTSISTTSLLISSTSNAFKLGKIPEIIGKDVIIFTRVIDAATSYLRLQQTNFFGAVASVTGDTSRPYATSANNARLFRVPPVSILSVLNWSDYPSGQVTISIDGKRITGTNNVNVDYLAAFPRPFLTIKGSPNSVQGTLVYFSLKGERYTCGNSSAAEYVWRILGDPIEFTPNRYNLLQSLMGDESNDPVIASTLTYTIYITPRYLLI